MKPEPVTPIEFRQVSESSVAVIDRELVIGHCVQRLVTMPWRFRASPSHEYSKHQMKIISEWLFDKNTQDPPV